MSLRTFASRTFAARTFMARTFNGNGVTITDPVSGWIAPTAKRHFVAPVANRLSITTPQDRVWIARADNG
jgi:hypothetical protein